ncbi:MAG: acyl carrier protein [Solobacterium sp.]|nr:acyl carrier protein [Solobacterium sp.]
MEKVLEILKGIRPDIDFEKETKLIDDKILDSFDIISIVSEFNDQFNIAIDVEDLEPDNFNTVSAMWKLITDKQSNG